MSAPRPPGPDPFPFTHGSYTLYGADVELRNGARRRIWFFALQPPKVGRPVARPVGYHVAENPHTGIPFLQPDEWRPGNPLARAWGLGPSNSPLGHKAS